MTQIKCRNLNRHGGKLHAVETNFEKVGSHQFLCIDYIGEYLFYKVKSIFPRVQ